MGAIWEPKRRYQTWLDIELLACEAMVQEGVVPPAVFKTIRERAKVDVARIDQLEKEVRHDVIAFLSSMTEKIGPEGRYLHWGMTSSDILDTALSVLMRQASDLLIDDIIALLAVLKEKAEIYRETLMIGRSHGMHGEPTTFGLKMALWYAETLRNLRRMRQAKQIISFGKLSGAMGTYAHISPFVEEEVCRRLHLTPEPVSNQIVQRDRHAQFMQTLALIASSLEKFALEIRHLQRTEIGEVEEPFGEGQKGSSAMPHKRNPIGAENICGLARLIRSNSTAALENVPLWHERDISHSSVERVIIPDSTILLDFILHRFTEMMQKLSVYPNQMKKNVAWTQGVIFSQKVLLLLIEKGMERECAYGIVQDAAMQTLQQGKSFRDAILSHPKMPGDISRQELDACFDARAFIRHLETTYKRVFSETE